MANLFRELYWLLKHGRGWRTERRTLSHPRLGELRYEGRRTRPGGHLIGYWKLQPTGFDAPFGVSFCELDGNPTPKALLTLESLLSDLDALFERGRASATEEYESMAGEPMPKDWRSAFRLDHISLPDDDGEEPEWQVSYWCEPALHWLTVTFLDDEVTYTSFDG